MQGFAWLNCTGEQLLKMAVAVRRERAAAERAAGQDFPISISPSSGNLDKGRCLVGFNLFLVAVQCCIWAAGINKQQ